jgi:hypothetical protein
MKEEKGPAAGAGHGRGVVGGRGRGLERRSYIVCGGE